MRVRALAPGGRLAALNPGGGPFNAYELLIRSAQVIGFRTAAVAQEKPEAYARRLDELGELHRDRTLCPRSSPKHRSPKRHAPTRSSGPAATSARSF
jgi:NADPH:quinone reductase